MYKCSECGQEFASKPDYCDCGNNIFDEIALAADVSEKQNEQAEMFSHHEEDKKQDYSNYENNTTSSLFSHTPKKSQTNEEKLSWAIFVFCIILSILSVIFIGAPKNQDDNTLQENSQPKKEKILKKNKNIPSIDALWQESAPISKDLSQSPKSEPVTDNAGTIPQPQKNISLVKKNNTNKQVKQTTPAVKKTSPTSTARNNTGSAIQKSKPVQKPKINPAASKAELLNYKIALRNRIASKINFAAVVGDGQNVISFKISPSGVLTNRAFSKLSNNDSLNDAVYAAVMQTPAYNPPPAAYKNETLKLSVKMYGGNFEVDLN